MNGTPFKLGTFARPGSGPFAAIVLGDDVIALAAQSSWTGELLVLDADSQRSIFLEAGTVVGATTNLPTERLGETLYRFGVITRAQLDAALTSSAETGKRLASG